MALTLTKPYEAGDVFIREDLSRDYDSISAGVANAGSTAVFFPPGLPMVVTNPTAANATAIAATEALLAAASATTVNAFVLEGVSVPPGATTSTFKMALMYRPAGVVINENALPIQAPPIAGGTPYTLASYIIAMNQLGFVHRAESTRQEIQTK